MSKEYYEPRIVPYKGGVNRIPKDEVRPYFPRPNYGKRGDGTDPVKSKSDIRSGGHHSNS